MLAMQESIQQEVVSKLASDRCGRSAHIQVSVVGKNVILFGTIPSHLAHRTVIRDVWCVPNVSVITDKLALGNTRVVDRGNAETEQSGSTAVLKEPDDSDPEQTIPARVTRALEQSDCLELDPWAVEVDVQDGTVTLEGMVPSRVAVRAAVDAARRTPGVARLRNRLILAP